MLFEYNPSPQIETMLQEISNPVQVFDGHTYKHQRVSYYVKDIFTTRLNLQLKSVWNLLDNQQEIDTLINSKYLYLYGDYAEPESASWVKGCANLENGSKSEELMDFSCGMDFKLEFYAFTEKLLPAETAPFLKKYELPAGFTEQVMNFRQDLYIYTIANCIKRSYYDYYSHIPVQEQARFPIDKIVQFLKQPNNTSVQQYAGLEEIDSWSAQRVLSREFAFYETQQRNSGNLIVLSRNMIFIAKVLTIFWGGTFISFYDI